CPANRLARRIHEQAHANAERLQIGNRLIDGGTRRRRRPPGLTRDFSRLDRYERALCGTDLRDEFEKIRPRIALEDVFDGSTCTQLRGDVADISWGDMALVCSRMDCNAWRSGLDADPHCLEHVRNPAATRVPKRGNFVDVDRKRDHEWFRLQAPGSRL